MEVVALAGDYCYRCSAFRRRFAGKSRFAAACRRFDGDRTQPGLCRTKGLKS